MARPVTEAIQKKRLLSYTLRTCKNCKLCFLCKENIMFGEKYRDGRKVTNLAHEKCVQEL